MTSVITYGTFDLFHIGHLRLFERAKALGNNLIVAVSTDEFNELKGKKSFLPYSQRSEIVRAIKYVDEVIPECSWDQKASDIRNYNIDIFCMGSDWNGKFDDLGSLCKVVYLDRTTGVDSTSLRALARAFDKESLAQLSAAQGIIGELLNRFDM